MGLHTFGRGTDETWRIATVLMMLGKPFWEGVAGPDEEADEALVDDYKRLPESTAFRRLQAILQEDAAIAELPESLRPLAVKARGWYRDLCAQNETIALLQALDGAYTPTSYGGDPIKNPDALPTGRNLYAFDPSRVPTQAAWEAGKQALEDLPDNFRLPVILADVEGFSYKEIAEMLDIPIGTVMSRLHRGRKAMQKSLHDFALHRGLVAASSATSDQGQETT